MKTLAVGLRILLLASVCALAPGWLSAAEGKTFSQSELDQMMAPIALYPDSLLSQILMASTYPADIAEASKWSKDNPDQQGDAAVTAVQDKSWDPSVMSLAAFPQVLEMMGDKPDWVQNMGDAFLAAPEDVMDTAQQLRKKAKDQGNLKTTEEQKVSVEEASSKTIIVVEPASPSVVYVPVYNPTVVYGTWWWPAYPPYYYHPVGYSFRAGFVSGIGFGIGIGITNALWGGCNWHRHSININVHKHNNININRNRLDVSSRNTNWSHNAKNRKGVPYRDKGSREKYAKKVSGAEQRANYRGRDAQREKARSTLQERGVDPAKARKELSGAGGDKARASIQQANRERPAGLFNKRTEGGLSNQASNARPKREAYTGITSDRSAGDRSGATGNRMGSGNHALRDVGNAGRSTRSIDRGRASGQSLQRSGGRQGGGGQRAGGGLRGR